MTAPGGPVPILRRLLLAAGYRLEDRPGGLRAIRRADHRGLLVVAAHEPVDRLVAELPAELVHRILLFTEDPGGEARQRAAELGTEVLTSDTLGPALGELLLPAPSDGASGEAEAHAEPVGTPASSYPEHERTVCPRLDKNDAVRLAGVDGFRYTLRLVPFYIFPYRVRAPTTHGGPGPVSDHLASVNAVSGRVEFWENWKPEFVADLTEPYERFDPALPAGEARRRAEGDIRTRHTVSVDHSEHHGGTLIIERRRVPPGPSDLVLGAPALVHTPYWYVESAEGRVILDAVTGARVAPREIDGSLA
jgi:hypothetical protein